VYYFYTPELTPLNMVLPAQGAQVDVISFAGRPIADENVNSVDTRFVFTDHLGTPILQTSTTGGVVWRAEYEPFGNVYTMRTGSRADQTLRFPGQQVAFINGASDEESYNIFRWYRAGWGRYTQADPIGLEAGPNVFAYVQDNPISYEDRLGLKVFKCCRDIQVNAVANAAARIFGFKHCFIKTDSIEAGLGPANGGPLPACPVGVDTAITDHRGQSLFPGTVCTEITNVNEKCVNSKLPIGKRMGTWGPTNNCNTFVDGVLNGCKPACDDKKNQPSPPGDDGRRYF